MDGFGANPYGSVIGFRINNAEHSAQMREVIESFGWDIFPVAETDRIYSLWTAPAPKRRGQRNFNILYYVNQVQTKNLSLKPVLDGLANSIQFILFGTADHHACFRAELMSHHEKGTVAVLHALQMGAPNAVQQLQDSGFEPQKGFGLALERSETTPHIFPYPSRKAPDLAGVVCLDWEAEPNAVQPLSTGELTIELVSRSNKAYVGPGLLLTKAAKIAEKTTAYRLHPDSLARTLPELVNRL